MTPEEFLKTIKEKNPPAGLEPLLLALWYEAKGDWEKCHTIVQDIDTKEAARIHAYLHRKEGDLWNADYWYRRANAQQPEVSLQEELDQLIKRHLQ